MLYSMTGFGRGVVTNQYGKFAVEVNSINRKGLELNVNLPKNFLPLEASIRTQAGRAISRGRVNVQVNFERLGHHRGQVVVNRELAHKYLDTYRSLKKELGLAGDVDLGLLIRSQDVVSYHETEVTAAEGAPAVEAALKKALAGLLKMRLTEGKTLLKDIRNRMRMIQASVKKVHKLVPRTIKNYEEQLLKKMKEVDKGARKEEELIMKEIAIFADRIDVTEELTRLESHVAQFEGLLSHKEPVGRTLDFIMQEMHREVNTIGSKANNAEISREVVFLKSELEKIREQVQNVE